MRWCCSDALISCLCVGVYLEPISHCTIHAVHMLTHLLCSSNLQLIGVRKSYSRAQLWCWCTVNRQWLIIFVERATNGLQRTIRQQRHTSAQARSYHNTITPRHCAQSAPLLCILVQRELPHVHDLMRAWARRAAPDPARHTTTPHACPALPASRDAAQ